MTPKCNRIFTNNGYDYQEGRTKLISILNKYVISGVRRGVNEMLGLLPCYVT